ncbi:MAG: hypothetical protein M3552_07180, partial [Planctomycetota bacterium]|nr:hypothetical protein [Planctomycetota bacterium]
MCSQRLASAALLSALFSVVITGCNSSSDSSRKTGEPGQIGVQSADEKASPSTAPARTPEQAKAVEVIEAALGRVEEAKGGKLIVRLPAVSKADNETLKSVALLPGVERLYLQGPGFDDEGMPEVAKLTGLRVLGLQDTGVSGEGLKTLE